MGNFYKFYLVFGKILNLVLQYFMLSGKFTLFEKAERWKIILVSGHTDLKILVRLKVEVEDKQRTFLLGDRKRNLHFCWIEYFCSTRWISQSSVFLFYATANNLKTQYLVLLGRQVPTTTYTRMVPPTAHGYKDDTRRIITGTYDSLKII